LRDGWKIVHKAEFSEPDSALQALASETKSLLLQAAILRGKGIAGTQKLLNSGAKFKHAHQLLEDILATFGYGSEVQLLCKNGVNPAKTPSEANQLLARFLETRGERIFFAGTIAFFLSIGATMDFNQILSGPLEWMRPHQTGRILLDKETPLRHRLMELLIIERHGEEYEEIEKLIWSLKLKEDEGEEKPLPYVYNL
jgi:hypothetical protein